MRSPSVCVHDAHTHVLGTSDERFVTYGVKLWPLFPKKRLSLVAVAMGGMELEERR